MNGDASTPAPERSAWSKVLETTLVMGAVLGFVFLGKWGKDALLHSQHPECEASINCTTCAGACGWCSQDGVGHCSAVCHTDAGECGAHENDKYGGRDGYGYGGGGFYWPMWFWILWLPCCGFYGWRVYGGGYSYGYGYGYMGRGRQTNQGTAQEGQAQVLHARGL